jgi:hypothetical protein
LETRPVSRIFSDLPKAASAQAMIGPDPRFS